MTRELYAAVTIDVVGSTAIYEETAEPLRPKLQRAIDLVNDRFCEQFAVPMSVILGDECQGLLRDVSACPMVVNEVRLHVAPIRCRAGVGVGEVVSEIKPTTAEMEGAAFALSRDALEQGKRSKRALTVYRLPDPRIQQAANAMHALIDVVQKRWTQKQWEAVRLYAETGDMAEVGRRLGLTPQAVQHRLRSTAWAEVDAAVAAVSSLLAGSALSTGPD